MAEDAQSSGEEVEKYTNMSNGHGGSGHSYGRFNHAFPLIKSPHRLSSFLPFYKVVVAAGILVMMMIAGIMLTSGVPPGVSRAFSSPATLDPNRRIRKAIIMASYTKQNITWFKEIPDDWEQVRYVADDPLAEYTTPRYQGREGMTYLTYIIDHYHSLPDYMVFHHGHERAWHQPEPTQYILRALNLSAIEEEGYVALRCGLRPSCYPRGTWLNTTMEPPGTHWTSYLMRDVLEYVYKPSDPWFDPKQGGGSGIPESFASACCAQFAVTRAAVQAKPRKFWERLRLVITRDPKDFTKTWGLGEVDVKEWKLGNVLERGWHYFFGKESVHCPTLEWCRNTLYQGKIHCDGTTTTWAASRNYMNINCTIDDDV